MRLDLLLIVLSLTKHLFKPRQQHSDHQEPPENKAVNLPSLVIVPLMQTSELQPEYAAYYTQKVVLVP